MIQPEDWTPVGGLELEPNALKAVRDTNANVVVTAGPGAGKTELLAQRADFLFRTGASPYPKRILAISFKVDAARNLQSRVRLRSGSQYAARFDSFTFHAFAKRLIDNYRPALTGQNALNPDYRIDARTRIQNQQITFDDLVPLALEILEKNDYARGALRQTYSHVFMDEFQDATTAQYAFLKEAFAGTGVHLIGVGDTKQRIMGFADALEGVMATFAEDFDATDLQLYQNFRSKPRLRRMQNRMILEMDPSAASPDEDLEGEEGILKVLRFDTDEEEAAAVTEMIGEWLDEGVPTREITVLARQQPHLITSVLGERLTAAGIPYRNEQQSQDLTAEPAAALIFNFLRVVTDDGRPEAYSELVRVVTRGGIEEADGVLDSKLRTILRGARQTVRATGFGASDYASWKPLINSFLKFVTRPALNALSPSYQQGSRLNDVIKEAAGAFKRELAVDGEPVAALDRLSEEDAVRILTVHKCKGMEFEKVIVFGVEPQFFWGKKDADVKAEFFVAISRAKDELVLTTARHRTKPDGANAYWREDSPPHEELLGYADES
ncbi:MULTISPECIES: UvrD-helicase domain-containing protein [unclassified Microbacterium]|uniref:UvrD-helicase domain-containing protein n=1 Tax=unclassified Microbacterium TaxID=2609290 RepID=UPI001604A7A6|nr:MULTISPECIES: ATP-dependent helicase [unclassified Microbacterium]QNA92950.1 ATP-dependent helicase [Microbacterium sp. Se63.02b]QYM63115.1 ATP-dependent helicase [Microbacterium sp. Se5.02b]